MPLTQESPIFYDPVALAFRPMDGNTVFTPGLVPVSAGIGNLIQQYGDGLYVGQQSTAADYTTFFVNTSTGSNLNPGTQTQPFQSFEYAATYVQALFPNGLYNGYVVILLQAGQTFPMIADFNIYGGNLKIGFYGDPQYGNYNSAPVGTGADPAMMSDLERPILAPASSNYNAQWKIAGFNRYGGSVDFIGISIQLPAAPASPSPSPTLYGPQSDVVRNVNHDQTGYTTLIGSLVNMTDPTAYWGFIGVQARSTGGTLVQYGSQFLVNGLQMSAANSPTTAQLTARQYFIKFYADFAGNNQQLILVGNSTADSSSASGILKVTWADTEQMAVASGKTNQASYPVSFDLTYGLRTYVYNINYDQQQRPINFLASRQI